MNTWKPIPSLDNRWEVCLETKQVRNTLTKKLNTLYMRGTPTLKSKYRPKGESKARAVKRSVYKLLDEVFPYWWIERLEEDEEVRPIRGFPDYYISTYGRVYSTRYGMVGILYTIKHHIIIKHQYSGGRKASKHLFSYISW